MHSLRLAFVLSVTLSQLAACGAPGASDAGHDGGGRLDAGGGQVDSGARRDAGDDGSVPHDDAGLSDAGNDASMPDDAGRPDGGPPAACNPGLGEPCDDTDPCNPGFECQIGRCAPQGRPTCGGFAGASCPSPYVNPCFYFVSADFGPCLKAEEQACACRATGWLDCGRGDSER